MKHSNFYILIKHHKDIKIMSLNKKKKILETGNRTLIKFIKLTNLINQKNFMLNPQLYQKILKTNILNT
jgi:hypothetical protein